MEQTISNAATYSFGIGTFEALSVSDGQAVFPPYPITLRMPERRTSSGRCDSGS